MVISEAGPHLCFELDGSQLLAAQKSGAIFRWRLPEPPPERARKTLEIRDATGKGNLADRVPCELRVAQIRRDAVLASIGYIARDRTAIRLEDLVQAAHGQTDLARDSLAVELGIGQVLANKRAGPKQGQLIVGMKLVATWRHYGESRNEQVDDGLLAAYLRLRRRFIEGAHKTRQDLSRDFSEAVFRGRGHGGQAFGRRQPSEEIRLGELEDQLGKAVGQCQAVAAGTAVKREVAGFEPREPAVLLDETRLLELQADQKTLFAGAGHLVLSTADRLIASGHERRRQVFAPLQVDPALKPVRRVGRAIQLDVAVAHCFAPIREAIGGMRVLGVEPLLHEVTLAVGTSANL